MRVRQAGHKSFCCCTLLALFIERTGLSGRGADLSAQLAAILPVLVVRSTTSCIQKHPPFLPCDIARLVITIDLSFMHA